MKRWRIDLLVNTTQADNAAKASAAAMGNVEKAAEKAAKAAEAAAERQAKALDAAADRATRAADRAADKAAKAAEAAAERQAKAADRAADKATRAADRAADRAARAAERQAEQTAKALDAAADRATRAADRQADRAVAAADRAARQAVAAKEAEVARITGANVRQWTDAEVQAKVSNEKIRRANWDRYKAALEANGMEARYFKNGWEGANMLVDGLVRVSTSMLGLSTGVAIISAMSQGLMQAATQQKEWTDQFIKFRNTLREVESMKGGSANTKAAIEAAKFESATGFEEGKGTVFRSAFIGAAEQYRDKQMPSKEMDKYMLEAGKLGAISNIEPEVIGELAGTMAGTRDFSKDPKGAARAALGDFNQALMILQRGRGKNAPLAKNAAMLSSYALNPDPALGNFGNIAELASAVSVAAQVNPEEAEVFTRATTEAIRSFQNPLVKEAGIKPGEKFFESIKKIAPVVITKARKQGKTVDDVLREAKFNVRQRKGLGAFINQGVAGGSIADREAFAATVAGPEPAEKRIEQEQSDPTGVMPQLMAEARTREAKVTRGAEQSLYSLIHEQAEGQLISEHKLGTGATDRADAVWDATLGRMAAGDANSRELRIRGRMAKIMRERAAKAGIKGAFEHQGIPLIVGTTRESASDAMNELAIQTARGGVNPVTGQTMKDRSGDIAKLLEEQNKMLRAAGPPGALPPGPAPVGMPLRP